ATACTYLLPQLLARFRKRYPGVVFFLREAFTGELSAALAAGELDLAIVSGDQGEPWVRDELIVVRSARDEQPRRGAAPRFVTFPDGSATRALLAEHFPGAEIVMELSGIAAVKTSVRAGIGMALLSRAAVARDLRLGRFVERRSRRTPVMRPLSLLHRGVERLPPAAAALRELLLERREETQRLITRGAAAV
ncbi:MAG: hypothetical protein KC503_45675, partial [Myxococcales bacterium]|nr:hypothetical protein [Myxococcales bacterium]